MGTVSAIGAGFRLRGHISSLSGSASSVLQAFGVTTAPKLSGFRRLVTAAAVAVALRAGGRLSLRAYLSYVLSTSPSRSRSSTFCERRSSPTAGVHVH